MNGYDALIAARVLNLDGGEGSGIKGHTTERPTSLVATRDRVITQQAYDRNLEAFRAAGLNHKHLHEAIKAGGFKLHPDTMVVAQEGHGKFGGTREGYALRGQSAPVSRSTPRALDESKLHAALKDDFVASLLRGAK